MSLQTVSQWPQALAGQVNNEFFSIVGKVMLWTLTPGFLFTNLCYFCGLAWECPGRPILACVPTPYFPPVIFSDPGEG